MFNFGSDTNNEKIREGLLGSSARIDEETGEPEYEILETIYTRTVRDKNYPYIKYELIGSNKFKKLHFKMTKWNYKEEALVVEDMFFDDKYDFEFSMIQFEETEVDRSEIILWEVVK